MKIKFLQVNIWLGGLVWDNLIGFIKKENPDIIAMQEVFDAQDLSAPRNFRSASILSRELDYNFSAYEPVSKAVIEGSFVQGTLTTPEFKGKVDQGLMVLSKFPIKKSERQYFIGEYKEWPIHNRSVVTQAPRALQHVTIEAGGKDLNVFNLHGVVDDRGNYDSPERQKMSQCIIGQVKDRRKVILAGDSNASQSTKAIMDIEQYLDSLFKRDLKSTMNMRRRTNPGYASAAVDLIMVSRDITVLEKSCPDVDVSDHYPLLAELEI